MAVSKRLRFEILRRDNHACRYCGRSAPEVKLTIDHVVPESLGGPDDPSNLVAACADCNGGKSSVPVDAPLVNDVANDAIRWAAAMRRAAEEITAADEAIEAVLDAVAAAWKPYHLPADWEASVVTFIKSGLSQVDLLAMVEVAHRKRGIGSNRWSYFCGCCWTRIRQMQDRAREILAEPTQLAASPSGISTEWTPHQVDEKLRLAMEYAERVLSQETLATIGCCHLGGGHCGDHVCMVEYATLLEMYAIDADTKRLRDLDVIEAAEVEIDA
ncbi:HNH endonuclease [Mycobacterium phage Sbash]|uniref:HNH endonuclease n=1 Tax=Mycobacterium phage Sbash TaxID=1567475 RepID=A0A0A7RXZ9_9CAUD|nr:HNH endonuclease [Mycobacterium phage Sbash]AJA43377.1 HNH endonuclease [Mycobacterium phage Sbash]